MPTRSVELTDHNDTFIQGTIAEGRFRDASEAVRAALHLLEQEADEDRSRLAWLRATTADAFAALDRGEGIPLNASDDIDAFLDRALEQQRSERSNPA